MLPGSRSRGPHTISPTALYTGQVWQHHGLGDPALGSRVGSLLYAVASGSLAPVEWLGGPTLDQFLLARHRIIDRLLTDALTAGRVGQVVELACGLSPRGLRMRRAHPALTYVEVDLPAMAAEKRRRLRRAGALGPQHRVESADVFTDELAEVFARLDPDAGVAVVTEGLLNYFPTDRVEALWTSLARELAAFPQGLYLSDVHLAHRLRRLDRAFAAGLGVFVRGRVHFHYEDAPAAERSLVACGFDAARVHRPAEYAGQLPGMTATAADRVRVLEARVAPA